MRTPTPVIVHTKAEDGFAIHPEAIIAAITPRTKAIIINSPANPTGAVISEEDLAAIADAAAKRGIWIIVDLCYEKLIYDDVPHNLVKVLDRTHAGSNTAVRFGLEGVFHDGLALRLDSRPEGGRDRRRHAAGALDVERGVDFTESRAAGADRFAGPGGRDAERIQESARQADGVVL